MIPFERFALPNGLRVLVNTDTSTPLVAMNILYNVGARNEHPDKTGFAHLFEHLMFGGSVNIPSYDEPLQRAGGENNAFTNNDITNYYLTIPAINIETAFWLESDRMLSLAFSEKSLEVQRQVVTEEFRQRYLNQPYGDTMLLIRPLAYHVHPYRWPTIGKEIAHIENATLVDVKQFFNTYYHPANAILTLSGNITIQRALELTEKWFGPIPSKPLHIANLPQEPDQKSKRTLEVKRKVPHHALYKSWHCGRRADADYHTMDLMTDILSSGKSSRLYTVLVKEKKIFSSLDLYLLGEQDPSLVMASGKLFPGIDPLVAEELLDEEILKIVTEPIPERELNKVRNKAESGFVFHEMHIDHRALALAQFEMMGDAGEINREVEKIRAVTQSDIRTAAEKTFTEKNSSTLYYLSDQKA